MSSTIGVSTTTLRTPDRGHHIRVVFASLVSMSLIVVLSVYGANYYPLNMEERSLSPKHALLRSSGTIGIRLGMFGVVLFMAIYLYYFRKRWKWLGAIGNSRHWLDFHIVMGLTAPVIIAFHAAFKFRGFAGMAFWLMAAVATSGVIGRYLYSQIPRSLNAAELSWQELDGDRAKLEESLASQKLFTIDSLRETLPLPNPDQVAQMSIFAALGTMFLLDIARPFRVAALRRKGLGGMLSLWTAGGFLRSGNRELESTIDLVRKQAALHKRMMFLSRSQQVFHMWHVVHRPFSYAFVVLGVIHIATVIVLGYF